MLTGVEETVLFVGGDERQHQRFQRLFRDISRRSFAFQICFDYHQARRRLIANDVDICLIADRVGDYSGIDLLREFLPSGWKTPCLMVLSRRDPDQEELAMRLGTAGFIVDGNELNPSILESIIDTARELEAERNRFIETAFKDPGTNLVSRHLFDDRLEAMVQTGRRYKHLFGLLILDFDGFKELNQKYGAGAMDSLIQQYAFRLQVHVRGSDTLARYSGDRLAMILTQVTERSNVQVVADRLLRALNTPFRCESHQIRASATCGLAVFPEHGEEPEDLIEATLKALKRAKRNARGRYEFAKPPEPNK